MSRWFFPWSSSIKKRACRYLLQHYLGHFPEERLGLFGFPLSGDRSLARQAEIPPSVNEFLESVGAPLEIIDGFIDSIAITIPWSALVTENCTVEVSGLQITCRLKYRSAASGLESQSWASCMTTSMQLAQQCLKEQTEEPSDTPQPLEGLEMFAQTIKTEYFGGWSCVCRLNRRIMEPERLIKLVDPTPCSMQESKSKCI
uniref:Autophagy-related protein 2 homolog A-like isoform X1 n=1 Tax=Pogona vitticeps TaxID=103695 RepID=A0ABM5F383_9SAUR